MYAAFKQRFLWEPVISLRMKTIGFSLEPLTKAISLDTTARVFQGPALTCPQGEALLPGSR